MNETNKNEIASEKSKLQNANSCQIPMSDKKNMPAARLEELLKFITVYQ